MPETLRAAMLLAVLALGYSSGRDGATLGVALLLVAMGRLHGGVMAMLLVIGTGGLAWCYPAVDTHRLLAWSLFVLLVGLFLSRRLVDIGKEQTPRANVIALLLPRLPLCWGILNSAALAAGLLGLLPAGQALRWSIILCLSAFDLYRQSTNPETRRPYRLLPLVTAYAAGAIFIAAFLEIGLRMLLPAQEPNVQYQSHPTRGVAYRPGTTLHLSLPVVHGIQKDYELRISSLGLRDREYMAKAPGEFRVLLLGDSFAAGIGVNEEDMPSRALEKAFAQRCPGKTITVINAGIPGYGPWQEHLLLMEVGLDLEPDLVVHQLYLTNDIHDEMLRTGEVLQAYPFEQIRFWLTRRHAEYWSVKLEAALFNNSYLYQQYIHFTRGYFSLMWLLSPLSMWGAYPMPDFPKNADRTPFLEHALVPPYPALLQCFDMIEESVAATRDACASRGIGYMAYAQPDRGYVLHEIIPPGPNGERYDRERDVSILQGMFEKETIDYLPLGEILLNHPEGKKGFFDYDPHMNETGIRILAEGLADRLVARRVGPAADGCSDSTVTNP